MDSRTMTLKVDFLIIFKNSKNLNAYTWIQSIHQVRRSIHYRSGVIARICSLRFSILVISVLNLIRSDAQSFLLYLQLSHRSLRSYRIPFVRPRKMADCNCLMYARFVNNDKGQSESTDERFVSSSNGYTFLSSTISTHVRVRRHCFPSTSWAHNSTRQ